MTKTESLIAATIIKRINEQMTRDINNGKKIIGTYVNVPLEVKEFINELKEKESKTKENFRHHPYMYQWNFEESLKYVMLNWDEIKGKVKNHKI